MFRVNEVMSRFVFRGSPTWPVEQIYPLLQSIGLYAIAFDEILERLDI